MTKTQAAFAALLGLCLLGCGDDTGTGSLIGATCKTADECDLSGVCVTDGPGGMCSLSCQTPGAAGACPVGAYCDRGSYTTDTQAKSEQTLCLPACKEKTDCRDGYSCTGVSSGPGKVCKPD
jgi:hypothetical protein